MNHDHSGLRSAFICVTTLFFAWGFVTATIDPLVPSVRAIFDLSYAESMLTQFAFFMAYGVVSLPAAGIVARHGFARAIVIALATMVVGCLLMPLATHADTYALVLVALFVIASGITLLQVAANPLAAALGPAQRAHYRLTLSQAFNSLGTVLAPYLGSTLMLSGGLFAAGALQADGAASRAESLRSIDLSFVLLAAFVAALALFFWMVRGRVTTSTAPPSQSGDSVLKAFGSRWAVLGGLAIFLYVGAEVSIASIMINFLSQPAVLGVAPEKAGHLLGIFYWGGAMLGRFVGSFLLTRVAAGRLLAVAALAAAALCLAVVGLDGAIAAVAALAVGLFNSVMFPTIFTLTLERSTAPVSSTSGLLCMSIVGGAILPLVVGHAADLAGPARSFVVPMAAYLCIVAFAISVAKAPAAIPARAPAASAH